MKNTQEEKAQKYCAKHGHAKYFFVFFGYVHCGRCSEQIGDKLGGMFPGAETMASPDCHASPCKVCDPIIKKFNKMDKKIFITRKRHPTWDTERVLKGIKIGDD